LHSLLPQPCNCQCLHGTSSTTLKSAKLYCIIGMAIPPHRRLWQPSGPGISVLDSFPPNSPHPLPPMPTAPLALVNLSTNTAIGHPPAVSLFTLADLQHVESLFHNHLADPGGLVRPLEGSMYVATALTRRPRRWPASG
jgi:hypothetical protein